MKIWITKYALENGIIELDLEQKKYKRFEEVANWFHIKERNSYFSVYSR